jgi:hypothetical protein
LKLERAAPGYTIQAASPGLTAAASSPIVVNAAAATQLVVASEPPSSVDAGAGFTVVALAEDAFGNVDSRYGGDVALAVATNSGGAALNGTLGVSAQGGVATFSGVTLDRGGRGYTLVLTSQGLSAASAGPLDVLPPPARVVSVSVAKQPVARHKTAIAIVVQFDQALGAAAAANPGAYMLTSAPAGKKHIGKLLPLSRPDYNAAAHTVTLRVLQSRPLRLPVQLRIVGSVLTDSLGRPLDGNRDGQPGSDFVTTLQKAVLRTARVVGPRSANRLSARAVDALLTSGFFP